MDSSEQVEVERDITRFLDGTNNNNTRHTGRQGGEEASVNRRTTNKLTSFGDMVYVWIYRYNLNTALYMLEPWERFLFNVIVIAVLAYIVYGLYYSALHPLLERIATTTHI